MQEEVYFSNQRHLFLSGVLNNGRPNSPLIVLIHGFAGNKDENGLFVEAERFFSGKGYNTFRFDVEGAGSSQGDFRDTTLQRQKTDLDSALKFLAQIYPQNKIGILGFSLGATVAVLSNNPRANAYAFWSPALYPGRDMLPRYDTPEIKREFEERGYLLKAGLRVGKRIIADFRGYNLESRMREISKPVLLVHGTSDPRIDYHSTIAGQAFFRDASLELVEGANHSFKENPQHREILFGKTYSLFERALAV